MSSSLEQCSLSSYDAIIDRAYPVIRLSDSNPLVQLHRKFWLQSLQDMPENESMNVDKDEDPDEGEGDETVPGCYVLNIGIESIWPELLVRKEYIRLYKYCKKYLGTHRDEPKPPSVVITGQPGIGKSIWITYALCQRLTEGEPVIWFSARVGISSWRKASSRSRGITPPLNSRPVSGHLSTPTTAMMESRIISLRIGANTSLYYPPPKSSRWKLLTKTTQCSTAIMDPWTREEISQAAVTRGLTASDPRIDEMYHQYGPTPRICLDFLFNEALLFAHEACYESALGRLSLQKLGYIASENVNSGMDDESHNLVLVTRLPVDGDGDGKFSRSRLEPITRMIKLKLRDQLRKETRAARIGLYKSLANAEGTRRIAGVVYESLAQEMLEEKIALKLVPMVKRELSKSGRRLKFPRWLSDHGDGANPSLVRPIDITPAKTFVYTASGLDHPIEDMVYYALEAQNQVVFDSFIMAEGKLYIFQFTIVSGHSIKEGIDRFFSKMVPRVPPRADWHFVFVVPSSVSEICCSPQPQDADDLKELLNEMNLFSAVLDCEA